jgi:outer membrane protein assembly factor BamD
VPAATLVAVTLFAGCAGGGKAASERTSQEWYDQGTQLAGKKKYDEALEAFREAARDYRGAELDADIQIALADTYFNKEEYPAAVESYTEFLRLHPHSVRADYAQFRIGLAWQKQMRSADRSPDAARKAAAAYQALLRGYPRSPLRDQAREGLLAARRRIAEHELAVADFYRRTGKYQAAAGRYEAVLRDFGDLDYAERALFELGGCYRKLREDEKAQRVFDQLRRDFPQGRYVKEIENPKG